MTRIVYTVYKTTNEYEQIFVDNFNDRHEAEKLVSELSNPDVRYYIVERKLRVA